MISKRVKIIAAVCGALVLLVVCFFGYAYYRAFKLFGEEDMVSITYTPVVKALDAYKDAKGAFPAELGALVPEYLEEIPSMRGMLRIQYTPSESRDSCALKLYSRTCGERRVYTSVLGRELNEAEKARDRGEIHGFHVLRDDS